MNKSKVSRVPRVLDSTREQRQVKRIWVVHDLPTFIRENVLPNLSSKERSQNLTTHDKYHKAMYGWTQNHPFWDKICHIYGAPVLCCEDHVQPNVETKLLAHKVLDHFKMSLRDRDPKDGGPREG